MKEYTSVDMNDHVERNTKESEIGYNRHRIVFITKWSVTRKQMVTTYTITRLNIQSIEFDTKEKAARHAKGMIDAKGVI